jgi:DNA-directed RNA polymerase specialized sigma24 family protein
MRMATAGRGEAADQGNARPALRSAAEAQELVLAVLREHAESLLGVARRHSLCLDDAYDAYQRTVEIFLGHAARLEAGEAHKWVHTVCKHEAMRLRASRLRLVGSEEPDLDAREARELPAPDEQVVRFERMTRSAEALRRLKPQELRALWLSAQGLIFGKIFLLFRQWRRAIPRGAVFQSTVS